MVNSRKSLAVVAVALALSAVGCSGGSKSSGGADMGAKFTIAYFPTQEQPSTAAVALKNFPALTGMTAVSVSSGPTALPLLARGTYAALVEVAESNPILAFSQKIPVKIVWNSFQDPTILVTRQKITQPQQLRGLRIAAPGASAGQIFLQQYLKTGGLTLNDIHFVNLQASSIVAAFETKAIDGAMIWPPFANALEAAGGQEVVDTPSNAMILFSTPFIKSHKDVVQGFICGMAKTDGQFVSEPATVYSAIAKVVGEAPAAAQKNLPASFIVPPSQELSQTQLGQTDPSKPGLLSTIEVVAQSLKTAGTVSQVPTFDELKSMVDPEFAQGVANGDCK